MLFTPDLSLIKPWHDNTQTPKASTYVTQYSLGQKQLRYIAVKHERTNQNQTTETIRQQVPSFAPDSIIIEAPSDGDSVIPSWYHDYAPNGIGEVAFAFNLANKQKIRCITGEPSQKQIFEGLQKQGFTTEDFLSWHICAMLKNRHEENTLNISNIDETIEEHSNNISLQIKQNTPSFSAIDFRKWYQKNFETDLNIKQLASLDGSPSIHPERNHLQTIMHAIDNVREPNIIKTIVKELNSNDKVLIAYGSAHEFKQRLVLQNMALQA